MNVIKAIKISAFICALIFLLGLLFAAVGSLDQNNKKKREFFSACVVKYPISRCQEFYDWGRLDVILQK